MSYSNSVFIPSNDSTIPDLNKDVIYLNIYLDLIIITDALSYISTCPMTEAFGATKAPAAIRGRYNDLINFVSQMYEVK
jgi:hypothetical protein